MVISPRLIAPLGNAGRPNWLIPQPRGLTGAFLLVIAALMPATPVQGADLADVLDATSASVQLAQSSQKTIDTVAQETENLSAQYRQALKQLEGLQVYNEYMEKQIANQEQELTNLARSVDDIEDVERQILPLMIRMLDALEQFIELDMPFLKQERQARVEGLRTLMVRADASVAEKFRRIMEAFQIENDFGRTIETYRETSNIDGATIEVNILRLGRIGLYYQTSDASTTGMWDRKTGQWVSLGSGARSQVRQGIRIARRQIAPDLLLLPVPAPEVAR